MATKVGVSGYPPQATLRTKLTSRDLAAFNIRSKELAVGLGVAHGLFKSPSHARSGVMFALQSLITFLSRLEVVPADSLGTLIHLQAALHALGNGRVLPVLRPYKQPKKRGQKVESLLTTSVQGLALDVVARLEQSGLSSLDARKEVAARLARAGFKPSRGERSAISEGTLRKWKERVAADIANGNGERFDPIAAMFDSAQSKYRGAKGLTTEEKRNRLLDTLERFVIGINANAIR